MFLNTFHRLVSLLALYVYAAVCAIVVLLTGRTHGAPPDARLLRK